MDAQLKAKWVEALRSGDYKQGKNFLYNEREGTHCCLGVLCVVNGIEEVKIAQRCTTSIDEFFNSGLTPEQMSWLGDELNDCRGNSFSEIADYIDENL